MTNLDRIGIELEGAWNCNNQPPELKEDGSVTVSGETTCELDDCDNCSGDILFDGEVCSDFDSLDQAGYWIMNNYPNDVNDTCGLHVHLSTSKVNYSRLMDQNFASQVLSSFEKWGRRLNIQNESFWDRLENGRSYCEKVFCPDLQIRGSGGRYTQFNYQAYSKHGTLEFRLLPMFQNENIAIKAVNHYIKTVQRYLEKLPKAFPVIHNIVYLKQTKRPKNKIKKLKIESWTIIPGCTCIDCEEARHRQTDQVIRERGR